MCPGFARGWPGGDLGAGEESVKSGRAREGERGAGWG